MSQTRSYNKYTPDSIPQGDFLKRFVVREDIYEQIIKDIKTANYDVPQQNYILVGQRGQGKTTLLRRIEIGVKSDEKLSPWLIPIKFAEEQYQVRTLGRLWEEIADTLQHNLPDLYPDLFDKMEEHYEDEDFCFNLLDKTVRNSKKKLLLLIDNIDELLNKFSIKEQRRLREILITCPTFRIIGGSSNMLEQHFQYDKPFYEFFRIEKLASLTSDETKRFLSALAEGDEDKQINSIIEKSPERIELLRRLTGGVPRTIVMLFDIFMKDEGSAFDDLQKILDEVTPLYKHRMDDLPVQLQDIMHAIAMNWDGIATKEIAKKTRLQSKQVSAQLKLLERSEIVVSEAIGKNKVYKIKERFFNIWYLMRFGWKRDKERVEWLVKFLESWCTPEELKQRAEKLIRSLKDGTTKDSHAFHMTEALGYAGLDMETEHKMKSSARKFLEDSGSSFCDEITTSDQEHFEQSISQYNAGNIDKALKVIEKIKTVNDDILRKKAEFNFHLNNIEETVKLMGLVSNKTNDDYYNTGYAYQQLNQLGKAEEFYFKAISKGNIDALNNLGILYREQKQYDNAEKYFKIAIEEKISISITNLAFLYHVQKRFNEAEPLYLKAIQLGDKTVLNNLGAIYKLQKRYIDSEKYLLQAISNGDIDAINNLGNLHQELKQYDDAEERYFEAIEKGNIDAILNLGTLYKQQSNYDKAKEYYRKALQAGNKNALISLSDLYMSLGSTKEAENLYLSEIKKNTPNSYNSYAWFLYERGVKPEKALSNIEKDISIEKSYYNIHSYSTIQLWNDLFTESHKTFLEWLDNYPEALDKEDDVTEYLILLLAKKQLHRTKQLFEIEKYQLKDRYKPIWYAMAKLMGDEMRVEIAKMGSELEESVDEIIAKVKAYQKKYN
jgi:tetratricopeptide (TPR) repeat protein